MKRIGRASSSRWAWLAAGLALGPGVPSIARAVETEVEASADAQFYTLRSPYGDPLVRRRRYTQTLGLGVYGLDGGGWDPRAPELTFRARLRMDADYGQERAERDPALDGRFVPGLALMPIDLMTAYLEGRRYLGGWLGFRLGRQYVTDALGWWAFDGALARVETTAYVTVEAYGGFEERGGLPMMATPRWEADGVYRGSRVGLDESQYPAYLSESKLAPAYGLALESAGLSWLRARATYRRVVNRDTVTVSPLGPSAGPVETVSGSRVSTERAGVALRADAPGLGGASASVVYDLYAELVSELDASLDVAATERLTLGADYDYYRPTFDADSIFNWFSHAGTTRAQGRVSLELTRRLELAAAGGAQVFDVESAPDASEPGGGAGAARLVDGLGSLSGLYRWSDGSLRLMTLAELGERGHRAGADVSTRKTFASGFYDTLGILSLYDWSDATRPTRDATSFSYVLGGGFHPGEGARIGVEWEHSVNRLSGQRFRVLATLDLTVLR